jgi:uncharacterized protein with NRDE domain
VCTVVCDWQPGRPIRILALRDELTSRSFDLPDAWWPDQPTVIGGRDRTAGGSWCVSDVASGTTALVLNRAERRTGTPSRGGLPLAAVAAATVKASVAAGDAWTDVIDHTDMAGFNLVLAAPGGLVAWTWDATELRRFDLEAGVHMVTTTGIDTADPKTQKFAPLLGAAEPIAGWRDVVTSCVPSDDPAALVVRHELGDAVYATVFGQLITASPDALHVAYSRTPWERSGWTERSWPAV